MQPSLRLPSHMLTFVWNVVCHMRSDQVWNFPLETSRLCQSVQLLSIFAFGYLGFECSSCVNKCSFYIVMLLCVIVEWINRYIKQVFLLQLSPLSPCVIIWASKVFHSSVCFVCIYSCGCMNVWGRTRSCLQIYVESRNQHWVSSFIIYYLFGQGLTLKLAWTLS